MVSQIVFFITHLNEFLQAIINTMGPWSYVILFLIVFAETGLVIFPFLPGESLIFFTSAIAGATKSNLNVFILFLVYFFAALFGDTVNYAIGKNLHRWSFFKRHVPQEKFKIAHQFFVKHGGKTVIFGRFVPLIRTFVPLISGSALMDYQRFTIYNFLGVLLWVGLGTFFGYFFGQISFVQNHFGEIFITIACCALIPSISVSIGRYLRRK